MAERTQRNGDGSQRGLRRTNARRVVEALRREGPSSQAVLARRSGLSRSAVNNIVHSLVADNVVQITAGATGRESTVSLVSASGSVVAVEIGYQRMRASVMSFDQQSRYDEAVDLDGERGTHGDIAAAAALVSRLLRRSGVGADEVVQVCVGLHAPYDADTGTVSPSSFLPGLVGVEIRPELEQRLQLPVFVDNDANFAAIADWTWGAGQGTDHFYYVESSNSIGSGIVLHGEVYRGSNGTAGEIGHIVVDDRGPLCNCGRRGCLAAVASGRAILLQLQAAGIPKDSIRAVVESAWEGDAACVRALGEAGQYLGQALSHVVSILAPAVVSVGGSLAAAGPLVLDGVRAALDARNLGGGTPAVRVDVGLLRPDMCLLGGVAHVLAESAGGISELPHWMVNPVATPEPAPAP